MEFRGEIEEERERGECKARNRNKLSVHVHIHKWYTPPPFIHVEACPPICEANR